MVNWQTELQLDAEHTEFLFQSLQPYLYKYKSNACKRFANNIRRKVKYEGNYNRLNADWRLHVRRLIAHMIHCERLLWITDQFIFYRIVTHKYVLYAFNTYMLRVLSDLHVPNDTTWCVSSLDEHLFPENMQALLEMFVKDPGLGDSGSSTGMTLLSVNNCLFAKEAEHIALSYDLRQLHEQEASPVEHLLEGYDETTLAAYTMINFLTTVCQASKEEAKDCVQSLFRIHRDLNIHPPPLQYSDGEEEEESQEKEDEEIDKIPVDDADIKFNAHCIQISIPRVHAYQFVYPAVAWGRPVKLMLDDHGNLYGEQANGRMDMGLETLLDSPFLGELQARIVGHPHFYSHYGGSCKIFHSNVHFDPEIFYHEMVLRLQPFVARAMHRLHFEKFL